jgi:hypothetical protein
MADTPPTGGIGASIRKIPPPVLLLGGGAILGIGYALYRDRRAPTEEVAAAGEQDLAELGSYELATQPTPSGLVYTSAPDSSAETVGAVGQTALETLGIISTTALETVTQGITGVVETLFGGVPAILSAAQPAAPPQITVMPAAPAPGAAAGPVSGGSGGGGACPGCNTAGRHWTNCKAAHEIPTPNLKSRDWNIYTCTGPSPVRWRRYPDGSWHKIA